MSKINLDKYYTPKELAKKCIDIFNGFDFDVTEIIEPSAGNGSFSLQIPDCIAYDLEPEHPSIIEQDFLKLELPYKKGRAFIGNPPFGNRNGLSRAFYKKACTIGDYIGFILPISQYQNNQQLYFFDMVYSEALPLMEFSGVKVLCCFNIYKRPDKGVHRKAKSYKLNDVFVGEWRRGGTYPKPDNFDFAMCTFGASLGKEIDIIDTYCQENYIVINNEKYRDVILDVMRNTNWKELYPYISKPKIQTWKIYKYLSEQIPELK